MADSRLPTAYDLAEQQVLLTEDAGRVGPSDSIRIMLYWEPVPFLPGELRDDREARTRRRYRKRRESGEFINQGVWSAGRQPWAGRAGTNVRGNQPCLFAVCQSCLPD